MFLQNSVVSGHVLTNVELKFFYSTGGIDSITVGNIEATCHAVHMSKSWLFYTQIFILYQQVLTLMAECWCASTRNPHANLQLSRNAILLLLYSISDNDLTARYRLQPIRHPLDVCKPSLFLHTGPHFVLTSPHIDSKVLVYLYNNL